MRSRLPAAMLGLTLLAAGVVLAGGALLARSERTERIERNRAALHRFAGAFQEEIERLEKLYESHLVEVSTEQFNDPFASPLRAGRIEGILQYSLLRSPPTGSGDFHSKIGDHSPFATQPLVAPVFRESDSPPGLEPFLLPDVNSQLPFPGMFGWIGGAGEFDFFWRRAEERRVVVLTIDRAIVLNRTQDSLRKWIPDSFGEVMSAGGPDEVLDRHGSRIAFAGDLARLDRNPDLVLPVNSRFGSWQIRSWDQLRTIVSYDLAILTGSAALAIILTLLGVIAFLRLRRALREAEQRVSFVNRVSHELRTPLTNILLNADLAAEGAGGRLPLIREECGRLNRLIDNVLTFSRREESRLEVNPQPCDIGPLIRNIAAQFGPALKRKSIRLDLELDSVESLRVLIDRDAFAQILGNLLSNIEKHAAGGESASISIEKAGHEAVLRVGDSGPGIPEGEAERIFLPFERLYDRVSEGASGTGLGLAISKELAGRLGGSLCLAKSDGREGAVFELRLPLATEDEKVIEFPGALAS